MAITTSIICKYCLSFGETCLPSQVFWLNGTKSQRQNKIFLGWQLSSVRNQTQSVYIKDPYKVLGVRYSADSSEIKTAYFELSKKFHPDKNKSPDAAKTFAEISKAYEVLSKDDSRREFNRKFNIERRAAVEAQDDIFGEHLKNYARVKEIRSKKIHLRDTTHVFTEQDVLRVKRVYSAEDVNPIEGDQWIRDHVLRDEYGRFKDIRFHTERKKSEDEENRTKQSEHIWRQKIKSALCIVTIISMTVLSLVYRE